MNRLSSLTSVRSRGRRTGLLFAALAIAPIAATATSSTVGPTAASAAGPAIVSIDSGVGHGCAVRANGATACWGSNIYGESTPPAVPMKSVTSGNEHSCGVRTTGAVVCWGKVRTHPAGAFKSISGSYDYTCGIRNTGAIACWGIQPPAPVPTGAFASVSSGGNFACARRANNTVTCWSRNPLYGVTKVPPGSYLAVDAGYTTTACGITTARTLKCWGASATTRMKPPAGTFKALSVGNEHACAIRTTGALACWGILPTPPPKGTFTRLSSDGGENCAVRSDGALICWAYYPDIRTNPPTNGWSSIAVSGDTICGLRGGRTMCILSSVASNNGTPGGAFTTVVAGKQFACGHRPDRTVACWGWPLSGGDVAPPGTFTSISAGGDQACGRRDDGLVRCWGDPGYGALPSATAYDKVDVGEGNACAIVAGSITCKGDGSLFPIPTDAFDSVSVGSLYACGRTSGSTLKCFGSLATGPGSPQTPPTGTFTTVDAGKVFACGIRTNGALACWGNPEQGRTAPPPGSYKALAVGDYTACAIRVDGTLQCWGDVAVRGEPITIAGSAPQQVFSELAVAPGNGRVQLSWDAPNNGSSPITDYVVQFRQGASSPWKTFADGVNAASAATVTGLANGKPYQFRVQAKNGAGASNFSTPFPTVAPKPVPLPPTAVDGAAAGLTATLTWIAPSNDGGKPITDYVIQYRPVFQTTWTTVPDGVSAATTATVSGLNAGLRYAFRVIAKNANGASAPSAPSPTVYGFA